jgi:PAS domain S-box-containing protein
MRGRIIVFNRAAEQLFGVSAEEAREKLNVIDIYPEGGAREMMRMLRDAPAGRVEAVRMYGQTRGGEIVPVEIAASLIRVHGEEVATVGLLRDLRERVRVEGELARTRTRLAEAEKQAAVTALAGATAHELNQPLTVVLGYVELLRRKVDASHFRMLDAIAQQAERMAEIVKRISRLTHIETQDYPGDRQIADLEKSSERKPGMPAVRR